MAAPEIILDRLREAGFPAESVEAATGGVIAVAGLVRLDDGREVFAKTLDGPDSDLFEVEADGLRGLRDLGGATTPTVLGVAPGLLVLERLRSRQDTERYWERLGVMVATLHTSTVYGRFGWHRPGWLGRLRQDNTWHEDGYVFFAERRILRWLSEPLVDTEFDREERVALERLCHALADLVPAQPPSLTHGDLWAGNVLADRNGNPALVDPAVSYTWPEVDLSMLWSTPRPAESARFFAAYGEHAPLHAGWQDRMPLLNLRELLSVIAHGDDDWGAARIVRDIIAPFRRR